LFVLGALAALTACSRVSAQPSGGDGPLVIELFTSQGCSSCPPADALLARLAHTGQLGDRVLAPLSFHVDYWDDLGWPDPFSRPEWTERQRDYARALGDDRVYTPELVVAGTSGMVGSEAARVTAAIASAPHQARLDATAHWDASRLVVHATAPVDGDVWVAIWQDQTRTPVARGENAGETLAGERVVRELVRVAAAGQTDTREISLDPAWHASGAVAFAQRSDRRIVAAALLPART
jgi:hypothetical protein